MHVMQKKKKNSERDIRTMTLLLCDRMQEASRHARLAHSSLLPCPPIPLWFSASWDSFTLALFFSLSRLPHPACESTDLGACSPHSWLLPVQPHEERENEIEGKKKGDRGAGYAKRTTKETEPDGPSTHDSMPLQSSAQREMIDVYGNHPKRPSGGICVTGEIQRRFRGGHKEPTWSESNVKCRCRAAFLFFFFSGNEGNGDFSPYLCWVRKKVRVR